MRSMSVLALYAALLLQPLDLHAQAVPSQVFEGDRIRVFMREQGSLVPYMGEVVLSSLDSLVLVSTTEQRLAGERRIFTERRSLPLDEVERLELSQGTGRYTGQGALIGAVAGGLTLGTVAAATGGEPDCERTDGWCLDLFSPKEAFVIGFAGGALLGGLIGAVAGYSTEKERWLEIPVGQGVRVMPKVGLGGAGFTIDLNSFER